MLFRSSDDSFYLPEAGSRSLLECLATYSRSPGRRCAPFARKPPLQWWQEEERGGRRRAERVWKRSDGCCWEGGVRRWTWEGTKRIGIADCLVLHFLPGRRGPDGLSRREGSRRHRVGGETVTNERSLRAPRTSKSCIQGRMTP